MSYLPPGSFGVQAFSGQPEFMCGWVPEGIYKSYKTLEGKFRGTTQAAYIILSYQYPHMSVASATLARYAKMFLSMAGIDITIFTAHSMRSASTSKANNLGLTLKDIGKATGWRGTSTFQRYYKLTITPNMGDTLLKGYIS